MIYQMSVLPVPNNMNYLLVADAPVAALDPMQELVLAYEPGIYQFSVTSYSLSQ